MDSGIEEGEVRLRAVKDDGGVSRIDDDDKLAAGYRVGETLNLETPKKNEALYLPGLLPAVSPRKARCPYREPDELSCCRPIQPCDPHLFDVQSRKGKPVSQILLGSAAAKHAHREVMGRGMRTLHCTVRKGSLIVSIEASTSVIRLI